MKKSSKPKKKAVRPKVQPDKVARNAMLRIVADQQRDVFPTQETVALRRIVMFLLVDWQEYSCTCSIGDVCMLCGACTALTIENPWRAQRHKEGRSLEDNLF